MVHQGPTRRWVTAGFLLTTLVLVALVPGRSSGQSLGAIQNKIGSTRAKLERARARYLLLRKKLARAQALLAKRLVEIYKSDQPDLVTVLLESDGFEDLLVR